MTRLTQMVPGWPNARTRRHAPPNADVCVTPPSPRLTPKGTGAFRRLLTRRGGVGPAYRVSPRGSRGLPDYSSNLPGMSTENGDDDGADYVCGANTDHTDGPCQFPVSGPDQRCHNHPADGSGPPEGTGKGSPDHTMGNGDGKIQERLPDNAKPALDHGVHAVQDDPGGTLRWIEDNDPRGHDWIVGKWKSYLKDGDIPPESGRADDILTACLYDYVVRAMTDKQIREGLTTTQTRKGEHGTFEIEVEQPGNLPADRLARRSEEIKRKNGVLDDPESKKAEAMGWGQAAKRVAERVDSDVVDVEDQGADGDSTDD